MDEPDVQDDCPYVFPPVHPAHPCSDSSLSRTFGWTRPEIRAGPFFRHGQFFLSQICCPVSFTYGKRQFAGNRMASSEKRVDQFLRLYHSHEVALRGIALSLVPRWADASEVIQEANLVMWQKFDEFEIGTNFQAWAGRIIQFKAKEFRRKQGRDQHIFTFLTDELSETLVEDASDLVGEFEALSGAATMSLEVEERRS